MKHTTGKIHIAVSRGQYPAYYLIGPPVPPFADLANNGPTLATVHENNPNAASDARLWANAARMFELFGDLLNSLADPNGAQRDSILHESHILMHELGWK